MEPQVSEPIENAANAAATIAAEPLEEPQVQQASFQGLRAGPEIEAEP